jgi:hypothetical protein
MNRTTGKKKALVFIDFDMLIRHFVCSGVFRELESEFEVKYIFHTDSTNKQKRGIWADVGMLGLDNYAQLEVPRKRMGAWDHLYCPTVLNRLRDSDYYEARRDLFMQMRPHKLVRRHEMLSKPAVFWIYSRLFRALMGTHHGLEKLLREEAPDIVFHPTILQGYFINELVPACRSKSTPLVCLMNSWDNAAQKAAATGSPDKLVVWGEQSYRHAVDYMGMPPEDTLIFGAAQFQVYRERVTETRDQLCDLFRAPRNLPIMLYGGTSKSVHETRHLEIIDNAIESGAIPKCHVIYRPHPWRGGLCDGEPDFFKCKFRHVTMDPHMEDYYRRISNMPDTVFDLADYKPTQKLLHLVDAVISPLSTILLESILHGKPVLVLMTNEHVDEDIRMVYESTGRQLHFREFEGYGIQRCLTTDKLVHQCVELLSQTSDPSIESALKKTASFFVKMDGAPYGLQLLHLARQLSEEKTT